MVGVGCEGVCGMRYEYQWLSGKISPYIDSGLVFPGIQYLAGTLLSSQVLRTAFCCFVVVQRPGRFNESAQLRVLQVDIAVGKKICSEGLQTDCNLLHDRCTDLGVQPSSFGHCFELGLH